MNPLFGQRVLLAIQATIALVILTAAGGLRLAVLSAVTAGGIQLIGQRSTHVLAVLIVTTVAVVAVFTVPSGAIHRMRAHNGHGAAHSPCARSRAQSCRRG